jgi:hypothetical protein
MNMSVLWTEAPCSLVEVYRRLRGACWLHQGADTSETSVNFCHATRRCNLEDGQFLVLDAVAILVEVEEF